MMTSQHFLKKILLIYFWIEKGERKRERNINVWLLLTPLLGTWPTTQARALTRNWTRHPLVHRLALNPQSYASQGTSQHFLIQPLLRVYKTYLNNRLKNYNFHVNPWFSKLCWAALPNYPKDTKKESYTRHKCPNSGNSNVMSPQLQQLLSKSAFQGP